MVFESKALNGATQGNVNNLHGCDKNKDINAKKGELVSVKQGLRRGITGLSIESGGWNRGKLDNAATATNVSNPFRPRDVRVQASENGGGPSEGQNSFLLFRESSTEIREFSRAVLSPVIADMLKGYPHEEVKTCITIDPKHDTYSTFSKIYNNCKKHQKVPDIFELLKHQMNMELHKFMVHEEEKKIHDIFHDQKDLNNLKDLNQQIEHLINIEHYKYIVEQTKLDISDLLFHGEVKLQKSLYDQKYEEWEELNDTFRYLNDQKDDISHNSQDVEMPRTEFDIAIGAIKNRIDKSKKEMQELSEMNERYYSILNALRIPSESENWPKNWIVDSITIRERQELSDDPSTEALKQKPLDVQISFKRVENGDAGKGDAGQSVLQGQPFKDIFRRVLQDQGIEVSSKEEEEFSSIHADARVFDLPTKWHQAFQIARGQAYEIAREKGTASSNNPYSEILPKDTPLELGYRGSGRIAISSEKDLPSQLAKIFSENPDDEAINFCTDTYERDYDSRYACKEIYQSLEWPSTDNLQSVIILPDMDKIPNGVILRKDKYQEEKKKYQAIRKAQMSKINEIDKLGEDDRMPEILEKRLEIANALPKYAQKIKEQEKNLEEALKLNNAYYMMLGAPVVWNLVEKLPKDYTVSYIAIKKLNPENQQPAADRGLWLAGQDYQVFVGIKRVDSANKESDK